ncbi:hypothetical protein [Brevundimonas sp.]|uniref:hypothetical protein n=1 Tax=Brevundimonas sp. TaxID=1871086 RepID=UPI002AC8C51A|nr:hypothetical protein [Brevundimonas sp.]
MTVESQADVSAKTNTPLDGRADWAAPVLQFFDATSAEDGSAGGVDAYNLS